MAVAGLAALLLMTPAAAQQSPNGSVAGVVQRADKSEPLSGIPVSLSPSDLPAVYTDAQGRFLFSNIPPGKYSVSTQHDGYVPPQGGGPSARVARENVSLRADEHIRDVVLKLVPTGAISGRVLDADGDPVVGTTVYASRPEYSRGGGRALLPVNGLGLKTDDRGEFRIYWLAPGDYYVSAEHQPRLAGLGPGRRFTYYPGTPDVNAAAPVTVKAETDTVVHLSLIGLPLQPTFIVSGTVAGLPSSLADKPVERFFISRPGQPAIYTFANNAGGRGGGRFELRGLPPGSYNLDPDISGEQGQAYTSRTRVTVVDRDVVNVTVEMHPGFDLRGRIVVNGDSPNGRLGAAVEIQLDPVDIVPGYFFRLRNFSNLSADPATGSFASTRVPPGLYGLMLRRVLPDDFYVQDIRQGVRSVYDSGFQVGGESSDPLEVIVQSPGGRVEGTVRDAGGNPAGSAVVALVPEQSRRNNSQLYHSVAADSEGRFSLRRIAPGNYRLFAWSEVPEYAWENAAFLQPYEQRGMPVSVTAGVTLTVSPLVIKDRQ
jgi:hypothetical protein